MKTEQQTRMELIDIALKKAGWNVDDPGQVVQEYDILVDSAQVADAFDLFIAQHSNLNSRQLGFLRLLKDFIIERE